jgi:hypothetical protein
MLLFFRTTFKEIIVFQTFITDGNNFFLVDLIFRVFLLFHHYIINLYLIHGIKIFDNIYRKCEIFP